jgi:hypothetical protein
LLCGHRGNGTNQLMGELTAESRCDLSHLAHGGQPIKPCQEGGVKGCRDCKWWCWPRDLVMSSLDAGPRGASWKLSRFPVYLELAVGGAKLIHDSLRNVFWGAGIPEPGDGPHNPHPPGHVPLGVKFKTMVPVPPLLDPAVAPWKPLVPLCRSRIWRAVPP